MTHCNGVNIHGGKSHELVQKKTAFKTTAQTPATVSFQSSCRPGTGQSKTMCPKPTTATK